MNPNSLMFDSTFSEGANEEALQQEEEYDDRKAHHETRRHETREIRRVLGKEALDANRQRQLFVLVEERVGEDVLVPGADEGIDRGCDDPRRRQRHDDQEERLKPGGAVDPGRLLELVGDVVIEALEQPDRERQAEREIRD